MERKLNCQYLRLMVDEISANILSLLTRYIRRAAEAYQIKFLNLISMPTNTTKRQIPICSRQGDGND